jgi:hypothetical protein
VRVVAARAGGGDEHQALAAPGELARHLGRDAPAERVADHRDPVDAEDVEQVAHPVRI